ncbi:DUF881 domain-containing protein [Actinacidiphila rubida]|uniref:Uncharacterized conserved protein YlxW, UPF0749 family n=1 Tax=Actinacidiphila rubida TaxID=310780 RepID=A0A1H8IW81_9ACTN|nr:DUF881 domain-containing protein [Actinacidiphila rubida]SEN72701.1 Uncharacterized conserved protein YlxW, UPF0749 family [Actinacidiphila rubida]
MSDEHTPHEPDERPRRPGERPPAADARSAAGDERAGQEERSAAAERPGRDEPAAGDGAGADGADGSPRGAGGGAAGGGDGDGGSARDGGNGGDTTRNGRRRLADGLWPPRLSRAQLIVALLLFVLGLGLAIQVRTTSDNGALRGARQEDLVRILTELDNRSQRLEDEKRGLDSQRSQLESSSNQAAEALKQTQQKEAELGVLAGTVQAQGPGITLTITDPHGSVQADSLLDTLQELRAAGAEAIQIDNVRVVADTYFTQGADGVLIDGHKLSQPYVFKVIGNPQDLEPALNIPGGVVQTLEKEQATADVVRSQKIVVDALRPSKQPDYARSSQ